MLKTLASKHRSTVTKMAARHKAKTSRAAHRAGNDVVLGLTAGRPVRCAIRHGRPLRHALPQRIMPRGDRGLRSLSFLLLLSLTAFGRADP